MRCVAEIYSVSNTYQTDKFQFVEQKSNIKTALIVKKRWVLFLFSAVLD